MFLALVSYSKTDPVNGICNEALLSDNLSVVVAVLLYIIAQRRARVIAHYRLFYIGAMTVTAENGQTLLSAFHVDGIVN